MILKCCLKFIATGGANAGAGIKISINGNAKANAQIQLIIKSITQLRKALASGNFTEIVTIVAPLLKELGQLKISLGGNDGGFIQILIQLVNQMATAGKSKNTAELNTLIAKFEAQLKQAAAAANAGNKGGSGGAGGGKRYTNNYYSTTFKI